MFVTQFDTYAWCYIDIRLGEMVKTFHFICYVVIEENCIMIIIIINYYQMQAYHNLVTVKIKLMDKSADQSP